MGTALTKDIARRIIETIGSSGVPPEYGFQEFTVGLDGYLDTIEREYLTDFISKGGAGFKLIIGSYGGGKTHFLYCLRDLAWRHNYVVSYVSLSQTETPFSDMDKIYRAIVMNIMYPLTAEEILSGYEKGLDSFIKGWYAQKHQEQQAIYHQDEKIVAELENSIQSMPSFEDGSFTNAIKYAFLSLLYKREDEFNEIMQWLKVEGYAPEIVSKYKILHKIDASFAFSLIRSLIQFVNYLGYSGLVILFDEAEKIASISSRQHEKMLNNLRQVIDECARSSFRNTFIFYAVPDESFLEGKKRIYEALRQRLSTMFDMYNPSGVKIYLDRLPVQIPKLLTEIGRKLSKIYEIAFDVKFIPETLSASIENIAKAACDARHLDISYKRLFVQALVMGLHIQKKDLDKIISLESAESLIKKIA